MNFTEEKFINDVKTSDFFKLLKLKLLEVNG